MTSTTQRGQSMIIIALAMVALLAAVGLAIDGGMVMLRKQQLQKSVDAAALAGVTELVSGEVPDANLRGQQLMQANGVPTSSPGVCDDNDDDFWDNHDYCGELNSGNFPGAIRYRVEAHWVLETYFMQVVGIDTVVVEAEASAEYFALVDMYANDVASSGLVAATNQSIFGPDICVGFGDPYTPTSSPWYDELNGVYTYRISVPANYAYDNVRVEIFDPDTANTAQDDHTVFSLTGESVENGCSNRQNTCLLPVPWDSSNGENPNPYWFTRIDENRGSGRVGQCGRPGSYNESRNTTTVFRLFYYEERVDGTLQEVDLAYYLGKPNNSEGTDLHWVSPVANTTPLAEMMPAFDGTEEECVFEELTLNFPLALPVPEDDLCVGAEPMALVEDCDTYRQNEPGYNEAVRCEGNGDFIVNMNTEVPGILELPGSERRDLYLQVRGIDGASENGYSLWAGPARSDAPEIVTVPSYINARQTYIQTAQTSGVSVHTSEGVGVFGLGHLPMNSNGNAVTNIPLTYIGPELSGQGLNIEMFDPDSGASPPILFYFDTIAIEDWSACFGSESDCQNQFGQPRMGPAAFTNDNWVNGKGEGYNFTIPSDEDDVPFYGGRLIARYRTGADDTFGWKITLDARPTLVD